MSHACSVSSGRGPLAGRTVGHKPVLVPKSPILGTDRGTFRAQPSGPVCQEMPAYEHKPTRLADSGATICKQEVTGSIPVGSMNFRPKTSAGMRPGSKVVGLVSAGIIRPRACAAW